MPKMNTKLLILNYYDSLIRQIDIYAEQILALPDQRDLSKLDDYDENVMRTLRAHDKRFGSEEAANNFAIKAYLNGRYEDPYESSYTYDSQSNMNGLDTLRNMSAISTSTYVERARDEMIRRIQEIRDENVNYYEHTLKHRADLDEKMLFEKKFCFLVELNRNKFSSVLFAVERQVNESFSLPFNLFLIVLDFCPHVKIQEKIFDKYNKETTDFESLTYEFSHFNQEVLMLHMMRTYVNGLADHVRFGKHVFHASQSEILAAPRKVTFHFSRDSFFDPSIAFDNQPENIIDASLFSNIKSFDILGGCMQPNYDLSIFEGLSNCGLVNLEYLTIWNVEFRARPFEHLASLVSLSLYNCNLEQCPSDIFDCVPNLQFLELFHSHQSRNLNLANSKNLKYLGRTYYPVDLVGFDCLENLGPALQALKLCFDRSKLNETIFAHFNPRSALEYLEINACVTVYGSEFDTKCLSKLTSLRHLVFSTEFMSSGINLDAELLAKLESLQLHNNKRQLRISVTNNGNSRLFSKLVDLKPSDLSNYSAIVGSNSESLNNLECLNLQSAFHDGDRLNCDLFKHSPNLIQLDLSRNQIGNLTPLVFRHTPKLKKLDLSFNNLMLSSLDLENLENLELLDLSQNALGLLPEAAFSRLSNLKALNLCYCDISNMSLSAFRGLVNLRRLNLMGNSIRLTPETFYMHLSTLEFLDLSQNMIGSLLPEEAFSKLSNLKTLNLSYCGIVDVCSNAFKGLESLQSLLLTGNMIKCISDELGEYFKSLTEFKV